MPKKMLEEMDDDVKIAMDVKEPLYKGSKDNNHQQVLPPHRIMHVFFGFLNMFRKENTVGWKI